MLASAGWDQSLRLWDTNGELVKVLEPHSDDIWSLAFSPLGGHILTGGQDRTVKWIDVNSGAVVATLRGSTGPVHGVAISKDGKMIAAGGRDGAVRVWDSPEH